MEYTNFSQKVKISLRWHFETVNIRKAKSGCNQRWMGGGVPCLRLILTLNYHLYEIMKMNNQNGSELEGTKWPWVPFKPYMFKIYTKV